MAAAVSRPYGGSRPSARTCWPCVINALAQRPHTPESLARALGGLIALEPDVTARGPMDLTLERMDRALELAARCRWMSGCGPRPWRYGGRAHLELGRLAGRAQGLEEARRSFHALGAAAQEKRVLVELSMVARHEGDMNAAWALVGGRRRCPRTATSGWRATRWATWASSSCSAVAPRRRCPTCARRWSCSGGRETPRSS